MKHARAAAPRHLLVSISLLALVTACSGGGGGPPPSDARRDGVTLADSASDPRPPSDGPRDSTASGDLPVADSAAMDGSSSDGPGDARDAAASEVAPPDAPVDASVAPDSAPDLAQPAPDSAPDLAQPSPDSAPDAPPDLPPPPPDLAPDLPPDTMPADVTPPGPAVVISEIMYHPVLEDSITDQHEFLELHNRWPFAVSLAGWRLAGEITFTFPGGTSIPAGGHLVVARNRQAVAATYGLDPATVLGDYGGHLDNGGGLVALLDAAGTIVDSVRYDDEFPWPIGADALGAGAAWLPAAVLPLEQHRYKGHSLERYLAAVPAADVAAWAPSPLDGATPGRANSVSGAPPPVVTARSATPASGQPLIRAADEVVVRATFSSTSNLADVRVEWFVDDLAQSGEGTTSTTLTAQGGGVFETRLPARPDGSIVRYRFVADRGSGPEVISPRPSDPMAWHAYFVSPPVATSAPVYQLYVSKEHWTRLYDNVNFPTNERRVAGCQLRDSWNDRVPAVFVYNGVVRDARVRYQGSRWNRLNGLSIDPTRTTISPLPDRPAPLKALSWNISLPRYGRFEGRGTVILNKLNQSCPGLDAALGERLYHPEGVPVSRVKFARLHVNGGYFHYMMDLEHMDEDLLKRYTATGQPVGDVFKSEGCNCDEGPYGWGDERPLPLSCGQSPARRYQATYDRKTHDWAGHADLTKMIDDLTTARASLPNTTAARDFFAQAFDVPSLLSYLAIRNWSQPWDDVFQNHFLYRRADSKWTMVPWDLDREFGEHHAWNATKSFFIGEQGNVDNRDGYWSRLKDAFIKA